MFCFLFDFLRFMGIISGDCPNSLVVKHVLGKDESQVRFLLRAPGFFKYVDATDNRGVFVKS